MYTRGGRRRDDCRNRRADLNIQTIVLLLLCRHKVRAIVVKTVAVIVGPNVYQSIPSPSIKKNAADMQDMNGT
jgi:hypothetical protein